MGVRRPLDAGRELLEAFEHSARVTEYLAGTIPSKIWRADPPGGGRRPIAAIVAHMQGLRRTFAKLGGAQGLPTLDAATVTPGEARRALAQSRKALTTLFGGAIEQGLGRIPRIPRRTVNMMLYLMQHDAHHRGQITMIARSLGHEFSGEDVMRMWGWKKLP